MKNKISTIFGLALLLAFTVNISYAQNYTLNVKFVNKMGTDLTIASYSTNGEGATIQCTSGNCSSVKSNDAVSFTAQYFLYLPVMQVVFTYPSNCPAGGAGTQYFTYGISNDDPYQPAADPITINVDGQYPYVSGVTINLTSGCQLNNR